MITVRTCGSGTVHNDERLQLLRKNLEYLLKSASAKIFKLHDHKGELSVYWFSTPTILEMETLNEAWSVFEPAKTKHFEVTILDKVIRL